MTVDGMREVLDVIMRLAAGEIDARAVLTGSKDEIDGLKAGINMLAEELAARQGENARLLAEMEQKLEIISSQYQTITSLSTPTLMVWEGVLVLPVIGVLDSQRARTLTEGLLDQVVKSSAQVVIVDVTGVEVIDAEVAAHLLGAFNAVKLLGAKCILTGLSPQNAQNMTRLGVRIAGVETRGSLHAGLSAALGMLG